MFPTAGSLSRGVSESHCPIQAVWPRLMNCSQKRVIKCLKFESTKFANKFLSVKFVPQIKASLILMEWGNKRVN